MVNSSVVQAVAQSEHWWTQWPAIMQAISAVVQAATAIIIVLLTRRLVRATIEYATLSRDLAQAANIQATLTSASLDLARQQYQSELSPMWHLSVPQSSKEGVRLRIANLSNRAARVTYLLMRVASEDDLRKFVLDWGMPADARKYRQIDTEILETIKPLVVGGDWTGVLEVAVAYHLKDSPVPIASAAFPFNVAVRQVKVVSMLPKLPPISEVVRSPIENNE